jgi:tRNA A37 N6-isopentenylltransferase MiaA
MIYLICGSTGAGKTIYALALSNRLGAMRVQNVRDLPAALCRLGQH